jgi:hypothetical protein
MSSKRRNEKHLDPTIAPRGDLQKTNLLTPESRGCRSSKVKIALETWSSEWSIMHAELLPVVMRINDFMIFSSFKERE